MVDGLIYVQHVCYSINVEYRDIRRSCFMDIKEKMRAEQREIFTLRDLDNTVTGYLGRNPNLQPIYISQGSGFVGDFITEKDTLIMSEGVMHVEKAKQLGYDNVLGFVPIMRTFSAKNIEILRESGKNVIIFADSDSLGINTANQVMDLLKNVGIKCAVYTSETARDFYEYLLQGNSIEHIIDSVEF